jgi:hypothetical protein
MIRPKLPTRVSDTRRCPTRGNVSTTNLIAGFLAAALATALATPGALAAGFCTQTADAALTACQNDARVTFFTSKGICINDTDATDRTKCNADAQQTLSDDKQSCNDQHDARLHVCSLLGEGRYDPEFEPRQFVNPDDIGHGVKPNPFFPIVAGMRWKYTGGGQIDTVTITDKTKLIDGVTCRVSDDVVTDEKTGVVLEQTDDWFAQDLAGNVWYCGELSREFETFKGDRPPEPELTTIEGSFKVGRNGDRPGTIMLASPQVGDAYREEFSLTNAEDIAEVISTTGSATAPAASCDKTCLVTRNTEPLEPGVVEKKYYAAGIGLIFDNDDGTISKLVEFTQ